MAPQPGEEKSEGGFTWFWVEPPGTWVLKPSIPPTEVHLEEVEDLAKVEGLEHLVKRDDP
jgi:hypothetical protein